MLEFVEEVLTVVLGNEACIHHVLHFIPCGDGVLLVMFPMSLLVFPPYVGVVLELERGHGHFLLLGVVVDAEDLFNLEFPLNVSFGVLFTLELGHCEL